MTERQFKNSIVKQMTAVGTYNDSFSHAIDHLAKALFDFQEARAEFDEDPRIMTNYTNKAGAENKIKNPIYLTIEKLRSDILVYCRELGLTPAGLKRINEQGMRPEKKSKFEEFLSAKTEARKGS